MNGAVMIRWGAAIHGREASSLDVFGKAVAHFEGLSKSGRINGHHEYFSVTGRGGGFMMIDGELDELMKLLAEPETLRLNDQAGAIVEDFEIQAYAGGTDQSVQQVMTDYSESLHEIGFM
jgi:hypothetical protein